MSLWTRVKDWFGGIAGEGQGGEPVIYNPATGLPMASGIDVMGSPMGMDLHRHEPAPSVATPFDDSFTRYNPATGLPMMGGTDIMGNPMGMDYSSSTASSSSSYDPSSGW